MSKEQQQGQGAGAAPAATTPAPEAPAQGKPDASLISAKSREKVDRATAAVNARVAERERAEAAGGAPSAAAAAQAAAAPPAAGSGQPPAPAPQPAQAPQRPELTATDYWDHLDRLETENRALRQRAEQGGLPEGFQQMPVTERLAALGIDVRDPAVVDAMLDSLSAGGGGGAPQQYQQPFQAPQAPMLPEGTDPGVVALFQQQQAILQQMAARLDHLGQTTEEMQQARQRAQQQAQQQQRFAREEVEFDNILKGTSDSWAITKRALEKGTISRSFFNQVAMEITKNLGHAPTRGLVLDSVEKYLEEQARLSAELLAEPAQAPAPVQAPATAPEQASTTLTSTETEVSTRKLTQRERIARAEALIKERQRARQAREG